MSSIDMCDINIVLANLAESSKNTPAYAGSVNDEAQWLSDEDGEADDKGGDEDHQDK